MSEAWVEIVVELPREAAEVMAEAVGSLTGGVEVRDADTIIRAGVGRAVIVTQCRPEVEAEVLAEVEAVAERMKEAGVGVDPLSVRRREAHEDEWRDVWKQYFRALRVGKTFLVRPSWDMPPAAPGDRVIDLDPGRAFGTGGHASTRLVIALAEEIGDRARGTLSGSRLRVGDPVDRGGAPVAGGEGAGGRPRFRGGRHHGREPGPQSGDHRRDARRQPGRDGRPERPGAGQHRGGRARRAGARSSRPTSPPAAR